MQAQIDHSSSTIHLEFSDLEAIEAFLDETLKQGAFLVELTSPPKAYEPYTVSLVDGDSFEFSFNAQPVQIFDRGAFQAVTLQVEPLPKSKELELRRKMREPAGGSNESETLGASPMIRIQQMDPNQKARLALQAGRTERQILRRENSPQILMGLLSNPQVEAEDVLQIVRNPHCNGGLLQRVASDRRWGTNLEIRSAIVRNPKTPAPVAVRLLPSLSIEELRQLAKVTGPLRENVRRSALAIYLKRSGQRR